MVSGNLSIVGVNSLLARTKPLLKELDFTRELPEGTPFTPSMLQPMLINTLEVILQVFRHCSAEDLAQASQVCKEWHRFTSDDQVWKELYLKKWRKLESNLALDMQPRNKSSWKDLYIERIVIENLCFPRKKSVESVQGLMYKASKLIGTLFKSFPLQLIKSFCFFLQRRRRTSVLLL